MIVADFRLKLKKISPREGDFPIILLRGGIADDL